MNTRSYTLQSSTGSAQPATLSPFDDSKPFYRFPLPGKPGGVIGQIRDNIGSGWVVMVWLPESGMVQTAVTRRSFLKEIE